MVHLRVNEQEPNPNPHVNFITALPTGDPTTDEAARQLLRALAAQVRPVMKAHGFAVNSLEEYEHNSVFAGRNWNHGETIELVLRSPTMSFLPTHWLMSTLCHELAHIKHMDHGPAFRALWRRLQQEVRALQDKGYYGDGYWSSGTRLVDSVEVVGQGIQSGDLPEYMCGGAHSKTRPVYRRRLKLRGLQTFKKRKVGSRVNSSAFNTAGRALNDELEGENKSHGVGFRKKAGSKRAREERAQAAEQRMQVLQGSAKSAESSDLVVIADDSDSEDDNRTSETDDDRRRILLEVVEQRDLDSLRAATLDLTQEFLMHNTGSSGSCKHGHEDGDPSSNSAAANMFSDSSSNEYGQIRTSTDDVIATRPNKKSRTSQSKLVSASNPTSSILSEKQADPWDCMVCTFINEPNHLACSVCSTPRGESKWVGSTTS